MTIRAMAASISMKAITMSDLEGLLDTFWDTKAIAYAGRSLPSLLLYLRDSTRFNLWFNPMASGLKRMTGTVAWRKGGANYLKYSEAVNNVRLRYGLEPQELDVVLILAGREKIVEPDPLGYTLEQLMADTFLDDDFLGRVETLILDKGQIVLYGPPGTGKTYVAKCFARYFIDQTGGEIRVVQFHPSYSYEEFIEGIRPKSEDGQLTYPVEAGIFLHLCNEARSNPNKRYVLIVDEINRGSLPRIFGELLYLLEYRDDVEKVVLPYSKTLFTIPPNLFLIGTMNTADRSIALVDHALRRRFHFIPLRPDPEILRSFLLDQGLEMVAWLADLLTELNQRLEQDQVDWHLHIGHSHWMVPHGQLDEERARLIWEHSVWPTLEEYFYKNPDRLGRYDYESPYSLVTSTE